MDNSNMQKSTFNKMVDFKKKISLLEGQRKAIYTKFEKEKRRNQEKEVEIGGEILQSQKDYIQSLTTNDSVLKRIEKRPHLNTKVLERMSPNSAVENLDYKVANLQRKLNKLKYKKKVKFFVRLFVKSIFRKKWITSRFSLRNSEIKKERRMMTMKMMEIKT